MTPRDLYNKNTNFARHKGRIDKGISSHSGSGPEHFYQRRPTKDIPDPYPFNNLNPINPPSFEQIKNEQKHWAQMISYYKKDQSGKLKQVNEEITALMSSQGMKEPFHIEEALQALESMFADFDNGGIGSMYETKNHKWTSDDLEAHLRKHENLIQELATIYEQLSKISLNSSQKTNLEKIGTMIDELKQDIAALQSLNPGDPAISLSGRSYLEKSLWIANSLKGRLLEVKGAEFLKEHVPYGFQVVDTANWTGPVLDIISGKVLNNGKEFRSDIGIFNKDIAKTIKIRYKLNGEQKETSLSDLLEFLEKNGNKEVKVEIPNNDSESMQRIQNAMIGIQAKSNLGRINFLAKVKQGRHISLQNIIDGPQVPVYSQALKELNLLVSAPYFARLKDSDDQYDALFNFCLSRYLGKIIGEENQIMLTRDGFMTVQDWLVKEFDKGKIMYAASRVHIRHPETPVAVSFGFGK